MTQAEELTAAFEALGCRLKRSDIQNAERLEVHKGSGKAILDVFNTGTLRPGGKEGSVRDFVKEVLDKYQSDPNFVSETLAQPSQEQAFGRSVDYSSTLLILDTSRHGDTFAAVEGAGHAKRVNGNMVSDEVEVWTDRDRVVVEGAADKVQAVIGVMNLGSELGKWVHGPLLSERGIGFRKEGVNPS